MESRKWSPAGQPVHGLNYLDEDGPYGPPVWATLPRAPPYGIAMSKANAETPPSSLRNLHDEATRLRPSSGFRSAGGGRGSRWRSA